MNGAAAEAPASADAAFDGILGIRLRRLQQALSQHWGNWFGTLGLAITPVQGGILLAIAEHAGLTQTALARLMQVETPTLAEAVRPLVAAGWVTKRRSAGDGRANTLRLSPAGAAVARIVGDNVRCHEAALTETLSAAERAALIALLDKALAGVRAG